MTGKRTPTIARRCPKVWTAADERALRVKIALLRADIEAAGGLTAWIDTRLEQWVRPPVCRAQLRPRTRV